MSCVCFLFHDHVGWFFCLFAHQKFNNAEFVHVVLRVLVVLHLTCLHVFRVQRCNIFRLIVTLPVWLLPFHVSWLLFLPSPDLLFWYCDGLIHFPPPEHYAWSKYVLFFPCLELVSFLWKHQQVVIPMEVLSRVTALSCSRNGATLASFISGLLYNMGMLLLTTCDFSTASSNTIFCYKIQHYLLGLISVVYGKLFYKIGNVCGTAIDTNMAFFRAFHTVIDCFFFHPEK